MEIYAKVDTHKHLECSKCITQGKNRNIFRLESYRHHLKEHHRCDYCANFGPKNRLDSFDRHMRLKYPDEHILKNVEHCPYNARQSAEPGQKLPNRKPYNSHLAQTHGHGKTDCVVSPCKHVRNNGFMRDQDLITHVRAQHTQAYYDALTKATADHKANAGEDQLSILVG